MDRSTRLYVGSIIMAGLATAAWAAFSLAGLPVPPDMARMGGMAFFILLGALGESMPIRIAGDNLVALSSIVSFGAVLSFDPPSAVLIRLLAALLAVRKSPEGLRHLLNSPIERSLFNAAGRSLTTACAGITYALVSRTLPQANFLNLNLAGFVAMVPIYFVIDSLVFDSLFARLERRRLLDTVRDKHWILAYLLPLSPLGLILAGLYLRHGSLPVIVILGPLLFARHAFEQATLARQTFEDTILALADAVEAKDAYTGGHCRRVARHALGIGRKLKLGRKSLAILHQAAILHDIGKIGVTDRVLNKTSRLAPKEVEELQRHPATGAAIIERMRRLGDVAAIVRHHHRHYDGGGYPPLAEGEVVPLESYILAAADAYDAMTTDRAYRKAMKPDEAAARLRERAGGQFHPRVVAAFLSHLEDSAAPEDPEAPLATRSDAFISALAARAQSGEVRQAAAELRERLEALGAEAPPLYRAFSQAMDGVIAIYGVEYRASLPKILAVLPQIERSDLAGRIEWIYSAIAYAIGSLGDPAKGLEWNARALALVSEDTATTGRRKAWSTQGTILGWLGRDLESIEAHERAAEIAMFQGIPRAMSLCLTNLSFSLIQRVWNLPTDSPAGEGTGLARQALGHAEKAIEICQAHEGGDQLRGLAETNRGLALILLGDYGKAAGILHEAVALTAGQGHVRMQALYGEAVAQRRLGHVDAARTGLEAAEGLADERGIEIFLRRILEERMDLEAESGDPAEAARQTKRLASFMEEHYRRKIDSLARAADTLAEAESLRREAMSLRLESAAWRNAALRDPLTGAFNRRGLAETASRLLPHAEPLALAALDADHFKLVNDRFGHAMGDEVLKALARIAMRSCRGQDVFARVGGEEFVLLMPAAGSDAARAACERIRLAVEGHDWESLAPALKVTTSLGLASRIAGESLESLIARADAALYEAKAGGRNQTRVAP